MYKITENDINYCDALCYKFHGYWGRIPDEDQVQDAREWMCIAATKYKPEIGKFMTYAGKWIWGAVAKEYSRTYNGYPKFSDVYYQKLQVNFGDGDLGHAGFDTKNERDLADELEKKNQVEKLVKTMPKVVEKALRRNADGEKYTEMLSDLGYNTRQALAQKIDRWRNKQGIKKGEKHID